MVPRKAVAERGRSDDVTTRERTAIISLARYHLLRRASNLADLDLADWRDSLQLRLRLKRLKRQMPAHNHAPVQFKISYGTC